MSAHTSLRASRRPPRGSLFSSPLVARAVVALPGDRGALPLPELLLGGLSPEDRGAVLVTDPEDRGAVLVPESEDRGAVSPPLDRGAAVVAPAERIALSPDRGAAVVVAPLVPRVSARVVSRLDRGAERLLRSATRSGIKQ